VGDLRLTDSGRGDALAWFDGDHEAADQFVIFAADRRLSLYGYWRHDHQALDAAPIVYLDSEATGNTVLTDTLDAFLGLLTLGPKLADLGKGWPEVPESSDATLPHLATQSGGNRNAAGRPRYRRARTLDTPQS